MLLGLLSPVAPGTKTPFATALRLLSGHFRRLAQGFPDIELLDSDIGNDRERRGQNDADAAEGNSRRNHRKERQRRRYLDRAMLDEGREMERAAAPGENGD